MKVKIDDLTKTYSLCKRDGSLKEKNKDVELIKSLKSVAERGIEFIDRQSKNIPRNSTDWTFIFRGYYESLRGLIEAAMLLDGFEAENHQCKNAYVCINHPEMDLDWEFLEVIRLNRNAINYRGHMLRYENWSMLKLKFDLHISALKKYIERYAS